MVHLLFNHRLQSWSTDHDLRTNIWTQKPKLSFLHKVVWLILIRSGKKLHHLREHKTKLLLLHKERSQIRFSNMELGHVHLEAFWARHTGRRLWGDPKLADGIIILSGLGTIWDLQGRAVECFAWERYVWVFVLDKTVTQRQVWEKLNGCSTGRRPGADLEHIGGVIYPLWPHNTLASLSRSWGLLPEKGMWSFPCLDQLPVNGGNQESHLWKTRASVDEQKWWSCVSQHLQCSLG